jgi:transglutaminase-like putative cysteine protease
VVTGFTFVIAAVVLNAGSLEGGLRGRPQALARQALDWYVGRPVLEATEAYLVTLLAGVTIWLVGYLAAWSLFRRGWILPALVLPGFLMLVNLGTAGESASGLLAIQVALAIVLMARTNLFARQREWHWHGLGGPGGLASRFLVIGVVVSLVATVTGWSSPDALSQRSLQPIVEDLTQRIEGAQESMSDLVGQFGTGGESEDVPGGSFASFGESFAVGGPLNLTNEPQVVVFADTAPYLTAQHYDSYTGRGWTSTTEDTFNPDGVDGRRYAPEMTFAPSQSVPLSDDVATERTTTTIDILPLGPLHGRMLTVDTYQASNVASSVRMSWIQYDGVVFAVADESISMAPRDVLRLVQLLQVAELTGDPGEGGPTASDPEVQEAIEVERIQLERRFLDVDWTASSDGSLETITVTGQVPVYDDVEAVFFRSSTDGDGQYTVTSRPSIASVADLQAAGSNYPDWVVQRYLQLPPTVTARTVTQVQSIVAGLDNAYDMAKAIETWLRDTVVYDETVTEPPEGVDIVDYLLFERSRGYCEYSASAMAVMLRTLGIPARVSVGFYPGSYDESAGGFLYEQQNAHAWTEVFIPGYGWIPFEPTSSRPVIDGAATDEQEAAPEPTVAPTTEPEELPTEPSVASPAVDLAQDQAGIPPVPISTGTGGSAWWLLAVAGAGGILTLAAIATWLAWSMPLRHLTPAAALYGRVRRVGGWFGIHQQVSGTPSEYGRALANRLPGAQDEVWRIVRTYEADTYGPDRGRGSTIQLAQEAWASLRRSLPRLLVWRR